MTIPPSQLQHQERRKHRRFSLGKRARVILTPLQQEAEGKLIDLSETGASLTTQWAVTAGVGVYLWFRVHGHACEATGSVVRVFPFGGGQYGLAIELAVANDAFFSFLHRLEQVHEASRPDLLGEIEELVVQIA